MITVAMVVHMLLFGPTAFTLTEEPMMLDDSGIEWSVTVLPDVQLEARVRVTPPTYRCEPTHQWPVSVGGECL